MFARGAYQNGPAIEIGIVKGCIVRIDFIYLVNYVDLKDDNNYN